MNIEELLKKDVEDLKPADFARGWHVMHNIAEDENKNVLGEAWCACYMSDVTPSPMMIGDTEKCKETFLAFQASPQCKYAKQKNWLDMTDREKKLKSKGMLQPFQASSLAEINATLVRRGFEECRESDVLTFKQLLTKEDIKRLPAGPKPQ